MEGPWCQEQPGEQHGSRTSPDTSISLESMCSMCALGPQRRLVGAEQLMTGLLTAHAFRSY